MKPYHRFYSRKMKYDHSAGMVEIIESCKSIKNKYGWLVEDLETRMKTSMLYDPKKWLYSIICCFSSFRKLSRLLCFLYMLKEKLFRREISDILLCFFKYKFNSATHLIPWAYELLKTFERAVLNNDYNFGTAFNSKKQSIFNFIWSACQSWCQIELLFSLLSMKIPLTAVLYFKKKLLVFGNT